MGNLQDRQAYVKLMQKLLGKEFRYVLNADEYDDSMFQGPPRNLPRDEVFNLFADYAEVDILEEEDISELVKPKGGAGKGAQEQFVLHVPSLATSPDILAAAIENIPNCPTEVTQWVSSSLHSSTH